MVIENRGRMGRVIMPDKFLIGCNGRGAQASSINHPISLEEASIDEQFRLVKEAGVFDYFDHIPLRDSFDEYQSAIEKYDLPICTVSCFTGLAPMRLCCMTM